MNKLPRELLELILRVTVTRRAPAYLAVDREGRLVDSGGALSDYGLEGLREGESAAAQVFFLDGLLPPSEEHLFLPWVETGPDTLADVHVARGAEVDWVLLLDAAEEQRARQPRQQAANELSLRRTGSPVRPSDGDP